MSDLDTGADLTALLHRSLDDLPTPADALHGVALSRGRRLRRRRRLGTALAGACAAAALAAVVVPATLGGSSASSSPDVASDPPSPGRVAITPWPDPEHWWQMPATDIESRLRPLLPEGTTLSRVQLAPQDRDPGEPAVSQGWLRADAQAPSGDEGGLEIHFYAPESAVPQPDPVTTTDAAGDVTTRATASSPSYASRIRCPRHPSSSVPVCTEITNRAGTDVGRAATTLDGDFVINEVTLLRSDGALVYVATANSTDQKWGAGYQAIPGAEPPLDLGQLESIAESGTWQDWTPQG